MQFVPLKDALLSEMLQRVTTYCELASGQGSIKCSAYSTNSLI